MHPSSNFFAAGEKGINPNVYIYAYPSREVVRILSNGTERAFSDLRFNSKGDMIATVGSFPDYQLHIWNWRDESIVLRAKAFAQEVFNVSFSPRFDGTLYTSGTGHVRFWKMADTFTGLKLQGEIGKFGAIELSDISAYQELRDGKVVTGSESGNLLLWDGGLIKVEIRTKQGPCHRGVIEMVWMYGDYILSAGEDGEIKFWDYGLIDFAEPCDAGPFCLIEPALSYRVMSHESSLMLAEGEQPPVVKIKTIHLDPASIYKEWLIQDGAGALWRLPFNVSHESLSSPDSAALMFKTVSKTHARRLLEAHAGPAAGVVASPHGSTIASAGQDGTLRLYDTTSLKLVYMERFPQAATAVVWVPNSVDELGTLVAVGFGDGVVRMVQRCSDAWRLKHVFKPHTKAVLHVAFSPDGRSLATASQDGTIFFMAWDPDYFGDPKQFMQETKGGWKPVGFVKCTGAVTCVSWSPDGERLLACCGGDSWLTSHRSVCVRMRACVRACAFVGVRVRAFVRICVCSTPTVFLWVYLVCTHLCIRM